MSYFKAKMHQIRFRSAPDPLRELTALPRPPNWIWGVLLLREGKGMRGKGREWKGEEKEERGKEGKEEGREGKEGKGEGCVMAFGGMDAPAWIYQYPPLISQVISNTTASIEQTERLPAASTSQGNFSTLWVKKKQDTKLLSITSPNVDQFSKFFHCNAQYEFSMKRN